MPPRGHLATTPPFAVEQALQKLGQNLRTARVRRNISLVEMASRLGVDRHVLADAERGKPTTGIGVYAGMLWAMDLLAQLDSVAAPMNDEIGLALARDEERERAYPSRAMSNDF